MTREVSIDDAGGVQTPKDIFKTAAIFVLRREKRLMSPREITQFALVNKVLSFLGETKNKTPTQSMENALNADANQTNENERVFVRVIVDEDQSFFGLREWHNDPTLKYLLLQKEEKKKRKVATVATVTDDSALASLKEFIETMGGHLPANWSAKVASRERTDKGRISLHTDVTYIDPNGKRYRSKLEVARCLNLLVQ